MLHCLSPFEVERLSNEGQTAMSVRGSRLLGTKARVLVLHRTVKLVKLFFKSLNIRPAEVAFIVTATPLLLEFGKRISGSHSILARLGFVTEVLVSLRGHG